MLRTEILTLTLAPGTRLSEVETGARFGASRTPVRDAMTRLRDEGLVVTQPSRGNFVTPLSEASIRSAHFIRMALETAAVAHVARTGLSATDDARLSVALIRQKAALSVPDSGAFHAADNAFHDAIADATGHPRLGTLLGREKTALDRLRAIGPTDPDHLRLLFRDNKRIRKALRKQDEAQAIAALIKHLDRALEPLADLKAEHGDYFQ